MLVDLIKPTSGRIEVCGYDVNRQQEQAPRYIGSIVENPEMYSYMTGWENLEHFARMQPGIDQQPNTGSCGYGEIGSKNSRQGEHVFSGNAAAAWDSPSPARQTEVAILDELTNGLDPKGIKEMRQFIHRLAEEGLAVLSRVIC